MIRDTIFMISDTIFMIADTKMTPQTPLNRWRQPLIRVGGGWGRPGYGSGGSVRAPGTRERGGRGGREGSEGSKSVIFVIFSL